MKTWVKFTSIIFAVALTVVGCQREQIDSLYNPNENYRDDPVINSVSPDSALGGISEITITGENFSQTIDENIVYFNDQLTNVAKEGKILSATNTELHVVPPAMYGDSIVIKLAVRNALLYANYPNYKLLPAVREVSLRGNADAADEDIISMGIAVDRLENIYVDLQNSTIKKVTPTDDISNIATNTNFRTYGLVIGAGDTLYVPFSARTDIIKQVTPQGVIVGGSYATLSAGPEDLDFDQQGNLWVAAEDQIIMVQTDGTTQSIDTFPLNLKRIRVVDNSVYVLGRNDDYSEQIIWKSDINGQTLSNRSELVNVANIDWADTLNTFDLDSEGNLYIATPQKEDGVYQVSESGNAEVLYPGLIHYPINELTWGNGTVLFGGAVDYTPTLADPPAPAESYILRIDLQKAGAIHYGRTL